MHARGHLHVSRFAQRTTNIIKVKLKLKLDERKGNLAQTSSAWEREITFTLIKVAGPGNSRCFIKSS